MELSVYRGDIKKTRSVFHLFVCPNSVMATIKARRQANGSTRYTAIVRKRAGGTALNREANTFTHRSAAVSWAKHGKSSWKTAVLTPRFRQGSPTLAELIRWYIDNFESVSKWQRKQMESAIAVTPRPH